MTWLVFALPVLTAAAAVSGLLLVWHSPQRRRIDGFLVTFLAIQAITFLFISVTEVARQLPAWAWLDERAVRSLIARSLSFTATTMLTVGLGLTLRDCWRRR